MRALLFDLDGTLTRSDGAGVKSLARALHARPQAAEELRKMRLDGMTDRAIARTLLAAEGDQAVPVEERARQIAQVDIDKVLERYLEALAAECARNAYTALPGVTALLERLAQRGDVLLGLCTGNLARGAELKLTSAGLWGRFAFGGYGSDAEPRAEIVRTAWWRARELGAADALVIGDTPRDVLAAHEAGLPACGVATGRWTIHELANHRPELVLRDFSDVDESLRLILGPTR
jgi:phosphoglycolate phosphatase-like HAD superfamily hydrolase